MGDRRFMCARTVSVAGGRLLDYVSTNEAIFRSELEGVAATDNL